VGEQRLVIRYAGSSSTVNDHPNISVIPPGIDTNITFGDWKTASQILSNGFYRIRSISTTGEMAVSEGWENPLCAITAHPSYDAGDTWDQHRVVRVFVY